MKKTIWLLSLLALLSSCSSCGDGGNGNQGNTITVVESVAPAFDADSAYTYVARQCSFGPRTMNSAAHDSCGNYIANELARHGAAVYNQYANLQLYDGTPIRARNIIASFDTANACRILVCAHWDSRPWADHDADKNKHKTPIDGANDGASGVGIIMEIARQLQQTPPPVGVDLVCFDAEDCGVPDWAEYDGDTGDTWCLGSQYWSMRVSANGYSARFGILLDMVGGKNTVFCKEQLSMHFAPSIVDKVWAAGQRIGYAKYFNNSVGGGVTDDHVPVNRQAGIPCIDIIGTNADKMEGFPATWHTVNDNIQHIDRPTLKAVGQTVLEVIYSEK
ncbi:MAG: M28 family peptidase [Bacteroidaceae bacterium]|nr:M28 family peptidase [Bacteroidaceae bacterium]